MRDLKEDKEAINIRLNNQARIKFGEAYQEEEMVEKGWMTKDEAEDLTNRAFRAFKMKYFDPKNHGRLTKKMSDLRAETGTNGRKGR